MEIDLKVVFFSYLKFRLRWILFFNFFLGVQGIINLLYKVPIEPISYGGLLILFFGLLFGIIDFVSFYKKHGILSALKKEVTTEIKDLPWPQNIIEEDYQELVQILFKDRNALISKYDRNRTEMLDYYSLWVHQIRTPISGIDLILQGSENIKEAPLLRQELFKIEQYVEMVLQYLRLEEMSSDLMLREYELKDLVAQALKKYSLIFSNKKISLHLEEIETKIITDKKWLVFVLEQVLSNALKYTKKGSISIYMDKNKEETLVIEDTGVGIVTEDMKRIFEKGFTGYNGRMNKKSTGIGLYLSHEILNKLSHSIVITSELDKGTAVRINFSQKDLELF